MDMTATPMGDSLCITVAEARIDAACAIRFKDRMREILMHPARRVVLDLSRVGFIDSSGLGALVAVRKLVAGGRVLELAGLTPNVARVFRLTRMDSVFTIRDGMAAGPSVGPPDA
jgi:anti-sigma B factor antagonist